MQEGSHIFDGAYAREFDHKAAEPVGVSAFARNEMKMFLTDGATILAFNTLDFHLESNLFMPDGNATDHTHGISRTDNMLTFTTRTTKFVRTGLDIWGKDNANEGNENLFSNCRVQLILCKVSYFLPKQSPFHTKSFKERLLLFFYSFSVPRCRQHGGCQHQKCSEFEFANHVQSIKKVCPSC